jgi:protein TonB
VVDNFSRYMIVSLLLHVAATGGLLGMTAWRPTPPPRPDFMKARVVSLPGSKSATSVLTPGQDRPAPAAAAVAPPKPAPKPAEQVRTEKKKPQTKPAPPSKKPAAKPKPEPTRGAVREDPRTGGFKGKVDAPAAPPTLLPGGGAASLGIDAADFTFSYYLVTIQNSVAREWSPPAGVANGAELFTVIYFQIERDGRIVRPTIETKSGDDLFDRTALRAVERATLPPLPDEFADGILGVHFQFEYAL